MSYDVNSQTLRCDTKHVHRRLHYRRILIALMLCVLLSPSVFSNYTVTAHAAQRLVPLPIPKASFTLQQFLQQSQANQNKAHGKLVPPSPPAQMAASAKVAQPPLPSAEPATMHTVSQVLSSSFLTTTPTTKTPSSAQTIHLMSSAADGRRLEVLVPAGALDLSHATTVAGKAPTGALTLSLAQLSGHFSGDTSELGSFQVQVHDGQGQLLKGLHVRTPLTFVYHYLPNELSNLSLNPGQIFLTWPDLIAANTAAHQSTAGTVIPMQNDPKASTLTAQSNVLDIGAIALGVGPNPIQAPPKPRFASVQGNAGQLSYSYPLTVAPGPQGTVPTLAANYSSGNTNQRHSPTSPSDSTGDGWSLNMGAITAEKYPDGKTWFSISGVDNVSDRLIPDTNGDDWRPEHLVNFKIQKITANNQPCFQVWDTSGNEYEFGCTNDSLQYVKDANGTRQNYRWDLDKTIPANEGPNANTREMRLSYVQDTENSNGQTWIRDAALKQITYGTSTNRAGTVDFFYKGPTTQIQNGIEWVDNYGNNENGCAPPDGMTTQQRCDDPLGRSGGLPDPPVKSTLSLQTVKTYVGDDSSPSHLDYSYSFAYRDTPFSECTDVVSQSPTFCAGDHLLTSITPTVFQNGVGTQLPGMTFNYGGDLKNSYDDTTQKVAGKNYHVETHWNYMTSYHDHSNGVGATIAYVTAYNNSSGTPHTGDGDNRYDALFCNWHAPECQQGPFAPTDQKMWTVQVVRTITAAGKDSSSTSLAAATTTFDYWLQKTTGTCPADSVGLNDCVGDGWIPNGDGSWQDFYHGEFKGFGTVLETSAAGDLTVQKYAATEGWNSPQSDSTNYLSGSLLEEDVYQGASVNGSKLIKKTINTYAGMNGTHTSCSSKYDIDPYDACEVILLTTRDTTYEQTDASNPNAPWVQHDNTYDDYTTSAGLGDFHQAPATGSYHNLLKEVISSSNAPTLTKNMTYNTTDTTVAGTVYHTVDKVAHSEVVDASNHTSQCQDITYDQGVASGVPQPAAGWPTTVTTYTTCGNSATAIKTYTGYDSNGNKVATVDGVGAANASLYTNAGCTLPATPSPFFFPTGSWNSGHYTSCNAYDTRGTLLTDTWNAFGQHTAMGYDTTQGSLPVSVTDVNSQVTSTSYSYDSSGNATASISQPGESGSYTSQATRKSTCTDSSALPCMEIDSNRSQYSSAITRVFYDARGRSVETLAPAPDAAHTLVTFVVYNDAAHSVFKSEPFEVSSRATWLDPNGATDSTGNTLGGTATTLDALERTISTTDALSHPSSMTYTLGTISGDSNTYARSTSVDTNNHVQGSYTDALDRDRYLVVDSGVNSGTLTAVRKEATQYNILDLATSVVVTDLAPQNGQTITTMTTTATYDDLGRMITLNDPDRGSHTYTYDANDKVVKDVSGIRTIGTSYDLLERVGCIQDTTVTPDAHGACTSGTNPFVQNTYDVDPSGVTWSGTNYAIGQLTQSYAVNYFPGPDDAQGKVTENYQYDPRGNVITQRLNIIQTGGTLNFPTLPQYQKSLSYNDANQPTTTQTTQGGDAGYTFTQSYDSMTGVNNGLSNSSIANQSLAALSYNVHGLVSGIALNVSGATVGNFNYSYDGNLRLSNVSTTQVSGSTMSASTALYDPAGNVTTRQVTQTAPTGESTIEVENFCYNEQNQLIWAGNAGVVPSAGNGTCGNTVFQGVQGSAYNASFAHTHLGQLWQGPLNGTGTQEQYLYCNNGQPSQMTNLSAVSGSPTCSAPGSSDYTASYNAWGDLSSRTYQSNTVTLSYDGLDHLVRWDGPVPNGGSANEEEWSMYDASGNRVLLRSFDGTNTNITVYAFGLEEHQYLYSGSGISITNTGNIYYYVAAGKLIGALTGTSVQTMTFFLTDALGSVIASYTNSSGSLAVQGYQGYGPYGNSRYTAGSIGTTKGFTGQYSDNQSGLDYYVARYYDPISGRFLSADTVQDTLHGFDPYTYVGGNPETLSDPTGHCWPWCTIAIGAIVGGVAAAVTDAITGRPVTWQDVAGGAIGGAALATLGVGVVAALGGPASAAAAGTGFWSVFGSTLTAGSATWGSAVAASSVVGVATGLAGGITSALYHFWPGPPDQPSYNQGYNQGVKDTWATATAQATKPKPTPTPTPTPTPRPIIKQPTTSRSPSLSSSYYTVGAGDSLSAISMRYYGTYFQWQKIYQANRGVVGSNPNLIYAGERLAIPH